jgi:hypothetical protein
MSRHATCNQCGAVVELSVFNEPPAPWLQVLPGVAEIDDDPPPDRPVMDMRADVCGIDCLASWAMSRAIDAEAGTSG